MALSILHLALVETTIPIGEVVVTIDEVGITTVVMAEVMVIDRIVVAVAIKGSYTIFLGTRVHLHQVYLLLIVIALP